MSSAVARPGRPPRRPGRLARALPALLAALCSVPLASPSEPAAPPRVAWEIVFEDGFEHGLARWSLEPPIQRNSLVDPAATTYRARSGSASVYMSGGGRDGVPAPGPYLTTFLSWMSTGPLDLSRFDEAYLELWYWARFADAAHERAQATVRIPGSWATLDLKLYALADPALDPTAAEGWRKAVMVLPDRLLLEGVTLEVSFEGDVRYSGGLTAEGVYVDDLRLVGRVRDEVPPPTADEYSSRQWEVRNRGQVPGCVDASADLGLEQAWADAGPVPPELLVAVIGDWIAPHEDLALEPGLDADTGGPGDEHRVGNGVGSAAAGFIGAIANNGLGVAGVAPGVRVLPIYLPQNAGDAMPAQAIDLAVARGAKIVLIASEWTGSLEPLRAATARAVAAGRVVVTAAGDIPGYRQDGWDTVPACAAISDAGGLCVGASSPADEYKGVASCDGDGWWSSAYGGPGPDLVAPGSAGCTTDRTGCGGYNACNEEHVADAWTCTARGTMLAAAKVAGVSALVLAASPGLSPAQVRGILLGTARDIDEPGNDDRTGAGRVDAAAAVRAARATEGVLQPIPMVETVEPASAWIGTPGLVATVRGHGFVPGSLVTWKGAARPTEFVSSHELRATLTVEDLAIQCAAEVSVTTPPPGGGTASRTFAFLVDGTAKVVEPAAPASPICVRGGQPATLAAFGAACHPDLRVEYQFDFGDGQLSDWVPGVATALPVLDEASPATRAPLRAPPDPVEAEATRRRDAERLLPALRERGALRVIVAFDGEASLDLSPYGVDQPRQYRVLPLAALTVDEPGLLGLAEHDRVRRIWPDELRRPNLAESVPATGAPTIWGFGTTGRGQAIAVLDTGVDAAHPMLAGRVVAEACFSSTDPAYSATSLCPSGRQRAEGPGTAAPCGIRDCEHGTHVAGIAAGGGTPLSGVAPGASIVALQVFSRFDDYRLCGPSGPCVASFVSDQVAALDWLLERHEGLRVAAVNMSLGGGLSEFPCDDLDPSAPAIAALRAAGVASVISAGNDGSEGVSFPACISSAVCVGAVDDSGRHARFSNVSPMVTLHAPGVGIVSSVPGGGLASYDGTSMAAPHVAGAFALLRELDPGATVDRLVAVLRKGGDSIVEYGVFFPTPRLAVARAWGLVAGSGAAQATHVWPPTPTTIEVRVRSRCVTAPCKVSPWSRTTGVASRDGAPWSWPPRPEIPAGEVLAGDAAAVLLTGGYTGISGCSDRVQHAVDWGDGEESEWLPAGQEFGQHRYREAGRYMVRARTRGATDPSIVSDWSDAVPLEVAPRRLPDLSATWKSLKRSCRGKGTALRCTMKGKLIVTNEGNADAPGSLVEMQLRGKEDMTRLERTFVPGVHRSLSTTLRVSFTLPPGVKGTGDWIVAVLDPLDAVRERDEANNEAAFGPLR